MESKEIDIRVLDKNNIKDAYYLYHSGLTGSLTFLQFDKKYNSSHLGIPECSHLAYYNNKPIGFYGIIPAMATNGNDTFLVAQACEFITQKEYRKQKVHYHLGKKCYERLAEHNCKFVFGFHSKASFNASKKLDWRIVNKNLYRFHIPLNNFPLMRFVNKLRSIGGLQHMFNKVSKDQLAADKKIRNILNNESGISLVYDEKYISYKDFSPNYIVELNNVRFWVKIRTYAEIGAIYFENEMEISEAFGQLIYLLKKLPVKEIVINAPYNSQLFKVLSKMYTPLPSWIIGFLDLNTEISGIDFLCNSADLDTF